MSHHTNSKQQLFISKHIICTISGTFTADENGDFTVTSPPSGLVRLVSYVNNEASEAFDIEIAASGDFRITEVVYDPQKNTMEGKTEPNAEVVVTTPDNPEQKGETFIADENGYFTITTPPSGNIKIIAYIGDKPSEPYHVVMEE